MDDNGLGRSESNRVIRRRYHGTNSPLSPQRARRGFDSTPLVGVAPSKKRRRSKTSRGVEGLPTARRGIHRWRGWPLVDLLSRSI